MRKVIILLTAGFLFFTGILLSSYAGDMPYCYHMVWGVITDEEGKPLEGIKAVIQQYGIDMPVKTDKNGIYLFYFQKDCTGYVRLYLPGYSSSDENPYLKTGTAVRCDFVFVYNAVYNSYYAKSSLPSESPIVYITNYGTKYHRYGCHYLKDSCIPMPYNLVEGTYEACSECW